MDWSASTTIRDALEDAEGAETHMSFRSVPHRAFLWARNLWRDVSVEGIDLVGG